MARRLAQDNFRRKGGVDRELRTVGSLETAAQPRSSSTAFASFPASSGFFPFLMLETTIVLIDFSYDIKSLFLYRAFILENCSESNLKEKYVHNKMRWNCMKNFWGGIFR